MARMNPPGTRPDTPARRLMNNKRQERIIFSGNAFYHINNDGDHKVMSGLLPVLKENFWPDTSFSDIYKTKRKNDGGEAARKTSTVRRVDRSSQVAVKKKKGGKGRFFGSIQGSQIHQEIEDFISFGGAFFEKKHRKFHPWTKRILLYLTENRGWDLVASEFKVFDEDLRIASAIDIVCKDRVTGRLRFVELKTGYKDYFVNHVGNMQKELSFMRNSPLNWANIQLTFCVMLLLRHHHDLSLKDCLSFVIRIDDESLDCYELDNAFIGHMYPTLLESIRRPEKTKKKKKTTVSKSIKKK